MSVSPQLVASHGLGSTPLQIALFGLLSFEGEAPVCVALCLRVSVPADGAAIRVELVPDACDLAVALSSDVVGVSCSLVADVETLTAAVPQDVVAIKLEVPVDALVFAVLVEDCAC